METDETKIYVNAAYERDVVCYSYIVSQKGKESIYYKKVKTYCNDIVTALVMCIEDALKNHKGNKTVVYSDISGIDFKNIDSLRNYSNVRYENIHSTYTLATRALSDYLCDRNMTIPHMFILNKHKNAIGMPQELIDYIDSQLLVYCRQ